MASRRDVFNRLWRTAAECYPDEEARQIAEMILLARGAMSRNEFIVNPNEELYIDDLDALEEQLREWRPVQYILGVAEFMDMSLAVNEGVLIPRPETEELVEWIASQCAPEARILDICTGSGCIAIALRRLVEHSRVWALDISDDALAVARYNAERYAPDVEVMYGDALAEFSALVERKMDVVVSNPPYIPSRDIALMRRNVVDHEPHMALFVPDDDPLVFYRAIARTSRAVLREGGYLYFEIYESLAEDMVSMLEQEGYIDISLRHDFRLKPRMICARYSAKTI